LNKTKLAGFPLRRILLFTLIFSILTAGCFSRSSDVSSEPLDPSPVPSATALADPSEPIPSPTQEAEETPQDGWVDYFNETLSFSFSYPSDWFGPDVNETEGSLRLQVGSDVVYPYGTDRTEQVATLPDSYYITIQYIENIQGRTWDDFVSSGWITSYLELLDLPDGDSVSTPRSLVIRVREVTIGNFSGLEYIATLPESAQTERVYLREIMAFDEDLNWLRVTGFPNNVQITDPDNWKVAYRQVDETNLEVFLRLTDSIVIE
jgi:hypothetical protein